ncbi:hypothetical protein [Amycolatopsis benzoatilytica]|uniref:hypothetical protein n=1 Tax=Amycolatopsis benzoatilytica TaxID=346045 RepID=UPI00037073E8|nr:hypothetical protein [Amycolatopsis benzoatilytica]
MTVDVRTTRDYESRTGKTVPVQAKPKQTKSQEISNMLLHEELSRARIRDLITEHEAQRPWRQARAARRWSRLADWAKSRAERHAPPD